MPDIIPVGRIILATTGEYEDYGVWGVLRVIKEFDTDHIKEISQTAAGVDQDAFWDYLLGNGYAEFIPYDEFRECNSWFGAKKSKSDIEINHSHRTD